MNTDQLLSQRAKQFTASEIRELLKLLDRPDITSFAGGIPDPELFPLATIREALDQSLTSPAVAGKTLQYSISEGYPPLREWIAARLSLTPGAVTPENVLITSGAQQALDFAARLLLDPGDELVVCNPTYLGALQIFSHYQPKFVGVPIDAEGPQIEALAAAFARRPKLFYIVTSFSNPSGVTVTPERRAEILAVAARHHVAILEDGAYDELYFKAKPPPSLFQMAKQSTQFADACVLYCGTFSKTIAPGFRIGWLTGPAELISKAVLIKQACDLHSSTLSQFVINHAARTIFEEHTEKLRAVYSERCTAMVDALRTYMPQDVKFNEPDGGFFIWLDLPEECGGAELLAFALDKHKVAFVPGTAFFHDRSMSNTIRLSFATLPPDRIRAGVRDLASAISDFRCGKERK